MGLQIPSPFQPEQVHLYPLHLLEVPFKQRVPWFQNFENAPGCWCGASWSLAQRRCSIIVCFLPFVCLPFLGAQGGGRVCAQGGAWAGLRAVILSVPKQSRNR